MPPTLRQIAESSPTNYGIQVESVSDQLKQLRDEYQHLVEFSHVWSAIQRGRLASYEQGRVSPLDQLRIDGAKLGIEIAALEDGTFRTNGAVPNVDGWSAPKSFKQVEEDVINTKARQVRDKSRLNRAASGRR